MSLDGERFHRRSIRLQGYDYSQGGAYFVTIDTQGHLPLFGDLLGGIMRPNPAGRLVCEEWDALPERFPGVELDAFVLMPDHLHGILVLDAKPARADDRHAGRPATLGDIVGAFKSRVTVGYIQGVRSAGWPPFRERLWLRNYYEHIIRSRETLDSIRQYIADNPSAADGRLDDVGRASPHR